MLRIKKIFWRTSYVTILGVVVWK